MLFSVSFASSLLACLSIRAFAKYSSLSDALSLLMSLLAAVATMSLSLSPYRKHKCKSCRNQMLFAKYKIDSRSFHNKYLAYVVIHIFDAETSRAVLTALIALSAVLLLIA